MHSAAVITCINLHFGLSRIVNVINIEAPAAEVQAPQRRTYVLPVAPSSSGQRSPTTGKGNSEYQQQGLQWLYHGVCTYLMWVTSMWQHVTFCFINSVCDCLSAGKNGTKVAINAKCCLGILFHENVSFSAPPFLFTILDTLQGLLKRCTKWQQMPLLRLTKHGGPNRNYGM